MDGSFHSPTRLNHTFHMFHAVVVVVVVVLFTLVGCRQRKITVVNWTKSILKIKLLWFDTIHSMCTDASNDCVSERTNEFQMFSFVLISKAYMYVLSIWHYGLQPNRNRFENTRTQITLFPFIGNPVIVLHYCRAGTKCDSFDITVSHTNPRMIEKCIVRVEQKHPQVFNCFKGNRAEYM